MLPLPEWPSLLLHVSSIALFQHSPLAFPVVFAASPRLTAAAVLSFYSPLAHSSVAPVRRLLETSSSRGIFTYILVFWAITAVLLFYHSLEWWKVKKGNMMRDGRKTLLRLMSRNYLFRRIQCSPNADLLKSGFLLASGIWELRNGCEDLVSNHS